MGRGPASLGPGRGRWGSPCAPWSAGPRDRAGARAKVPWDKFRGGERSCCCPGAEGGEGLPAPASGQRPGPRLPVPKLSYTLSRTCDSSSGGPPDSSALRPWTPTSEEARVRSPLRSLRACLCGLVVRTLRAYATPRVFEPQYRQL